MLAFERRWVHEILGSFAPEAGPGLAPRANEVDYLAAFEALLAGSTPVAALTFRLSLWLLAWSPLWLFRGLRLLPDLSRSGRDEILSALLDHRVYMVREAAFLLRMAACLALFKSDSVRARSRYDGEPGSPLSLRRGAE